MRVMYPPHNKVLYDKDIRAIRERYFGGIEKIKELKAELKYLLNHTVQANIARDYNVSAPHINRILKNKIRTNVKFKVTAHPVLGSKAFELEAPYKEAKRNREIAAANEMRVGHKLLCNDFEEAE